MGGSSLDAKQALTYIQQTISPKMNAGLFVANPTIAQLAQAIEQFRITNNNQ